MMAPPPARSNGPAADDPAERAPTRPRRRSCSSSGWSSWRSAPEPARDRRLFLGDRGNGDLRLVVADRARSGRRRGGGQGGQGPRPAQRGPPERLSDSVPQIREWVLGPATAGPWWSARSRGLPPAASRTARRPRTRQSLDLLLDWLSTLWEVTAGPTIRHRGRPGAGRPGAQPLPRRRQGPARDRCAAAGPRPRSRRSRW